MLTAVLALLALSPVEGVAPQDAGVEIPFERIPKKGSSAQGPACEKIIRDAKAWKAFWEHYGSSQIPPLPAVNFAEETVVAVVDPYKPSSGYKVEILKITRVRDAVVVTLKRSVPPKGGGQLAVMTEPSTVVRARIPADLPVRFVEEKP